MLGCDRAKSRRPDSCPLKPFGVCTLPQERRRSHDGMTTEPEVLKLRKVHLCDAYTDAVPCGRGITWPRHPIWPRPVAASGCHK